MRITKRPSPNGTILQTFPYSGYDNSIVSQTLYVKIIEGERFYKINGEHVRMLAGTEYVNGFGYNAVTASYRLLL